ncbi:MAG: hypothetical protein FWG66_00305 [Spirochaetes bacterium]|nr:hypothetical protein [Spirochaetota bacterium]
MKRLYIKNIIQDEDLNEIIKSYQEKGKQGLIPWAEKYNINLASLRCFIRKLGIRVSKWCKNKFSKEQIEEMSKIYFVKGGRALEEYIKKNIDCGDYSIDSIRGFLSRNRSKLNFKIKQKRAGEGYKMSLLSKTDLKELKLAYSKEGVKALESKAKELNMKPNSLLVALRRKGIKMVYK